MACGLPEDAGTGNSTVGPKIILHCSAQDSITRVLYSKECSEKSYAQESTGGYLDLAKCYRRTISSTTEIECGASVGTNLRSGADSTKKYLRGKSRDSKVTSKLTRASGRYSLRREECNDL